MARRLSSPVFVGRSNELRTLLSAADAAASGLPRGALVGGEAGVGKSRLVAEFSTRLRDRGWLVLQGGSVALGDDSLPFGPIIEALRALVREVDADRIAAAAGPSLPELARLVPELSGIAGDAPVPTIQPEWLQIRIFGGILSLLGRLGETTPVLIVLEDLQWSDRSTRDLLAFLARNVREERLLVVGTFRTDEVDRNHPMTAWLAEAERLPGVLYIDLPRFERDELVELMTAIAGAPPAAGALVDSIARRSDGNAFFAEELAAAVGEDGQWRERLPETLRGVLLVRMSVVSEAARRLVEVAAVAGRQVEHDVLAEVCVMREAEMRSALREVIDAQILVVGHGDAAGSLPVPARPRAGGRLRRVAAIRAPGPPRGVRPGDRGPSRGRRRGGRGEPARRARPSLDGGPRSDPGTGRGDRGGRRLTRRLCLRRGGAPVRTGDRAVGPGPRGGPTGRPQPRRSVRRGKCRRDGRRRRVAGGRPRSSSDRARGQRDRAGRRPGASSTGTRAVRARVLAGRRHRDLDPPARGGGRAARGGGAVDRSGAGSGGPGREPHAGRAIG